MTGDVAALGSCCLGFPLVMDSSLEMWAKSNTLSRRLLLVIVFCHSKVNKTVMGVIIHSFLFLFFENMSTDFIVCIVIKYLKGKKSTYSLKSHKEPLITHGRKLNIFKNMFKIL